MPSQQHTPAYNTAPQLHSPNNSSATDPPLQGDGGELELVPWLQPAVALAPRNNRAIVFSSERMLHRVLRQLIYSGAKLLCNCTTLLY